MTALYCVSVIIANKAWHTLKKPDSSSWSHFTNSLTLIQQSCSLSCCVKTGGGPQLPEHSGQRSQPLAKSADGLPVGFWFSSILVWQKPAKWPASVGPADIHTDRMSAVFYWTSQWLPTFGQCVLGITANFCCISRLNSKLDKKFQPTMLLSHCSPNTVVHTQYVCSYCSKIPVQFLILSYIAVYWWKVFICFKRVLHTYTSL